MADASAGGRAFLAGLLAAGALVAYLLVGPPAGPAARMAYLGRAMHAVTASRPADDRRIVVHARGRAVAVPVALRLDRRAAVRLALEIEARRPKADRAAAEAAAPDRTERRGEYLRLSAEQARAVRDVLKVGADPALLVMHALGWPFLGPDPAPPAPSPGGQPGPARRPEAIAREAPAWPAAEEQLRRQGYGEVAIFRIRAVLLRRAIDGAFHSDSGLERAREALGKYADLAPAQAEAVLAMAGALALVRAGAGARPFLAHVVRERPELAAALPGAGQR